MNYDNMTREDLIEIIEKIRRNFEIMKIKLEGLNHPDPEAEPVGKYRCECGSQILLRNRKRHEASARHIARVVQIKE